MGQKIEIDSNLCVRCGQCVSVCPGRILSRHSAQDAPECIEGQAGSCIACCHCVAVCVGKAIRINGFGSEDCLEDDQSNICRFENFAHLVRTRRSIRRYADKPIQDSVIEQMLDVVRWAPTAKNGLPVQWVIINNADKVKELAGLVVEWIKKQQGNEAMIASITDAWNSGKDPVFRGAPCVIAAYTDDMSPLAGWAPIDTAIAVETLDLCATAMRLGACWAGIFTRAAQADKPAFHRWLNIKETDTIHGAIMLGHIGEEKYQRIPYRPDTPKKWIR